MDPCQSSGTVAHFYAAHFIDGRFVESGAAYDIRNPATGELVATGGEASTDLVDQAVQAARRALAGPWGRMSAPERAAILRRIAEGIRARFDAFVTAEVLDTGKPRSLASHLDIPRGAANFEIFADQLMAVSGEVFETATPDGRGAINYSIRKPRGVIAAICPWNLPLLLMTWKVAPALAFGNTIIVKPSEETPATAALLGEVMNAAGVPPGVYNVVQGFGEASTGAALAAHPGVDGITFTGETRTGEAIMRAAAVGIRPVSLELGGKNAALIFADCDLNAAIDGVTRSAFANCGQVCLSTERVYVERSIFQTFVDRLKVAAEALTPGDPSQDATTLGPLISLQHREKVLSYYHQARNDGATVVTGGGMPDMPPGLAGGAWIQPTIWTDLPPQSAVIREEVFGPCCHIAPFDDEDEAVAAANDSPYGLCASIWTSDLARAHRVAGRLDVGLAWINAWFLRDLRTAFGGAKQSGIGREGGVHGLEFYTELKNVCLKL